MQKEFTEINSISVKGGGNISVGSDGILSMSPDPVSIVQKSSELVVEFPTTGIIQNGFCSSVSMSSYGSSSVMINGKKIEMKGDKIYINGIQYVPVDSGKTVIPEKVTKTYSIANCKIGNVTILGSASVNISSEFISLKSFNIVITGSGDFVFPKTEAIEDLSVVISGSGDINCFKNIFNSARINISGSGDVKKFHILKHATLVVSGSGSISGTREPNANVNKKVSGSGDIKIKKI